MSIVLVRNWWVLALRGLIAVHFGLAAFFWPGGIGPQALAVLGPLFGAYAIINGFFAIGIAFMERGQYERWWVLEHSLVGAPPGRISRYCSRYHNLRLAIHCNWYAAIHHRSLGDRQWSARAQRRRVAAKRVQG